MAIETTPVGKHVLIDIEGARRLDDAALLERIMRDAARAANSRIVAANIHLFGEGQGVTGVLLLAESHISVHTWPEHGFAAFDVFMCGSASIGEAVETIAGAFPEAKISTWSVGRGTTAQVAARAATGGMRNARPD